jgi:hypothetical protein
VIRRGPTISWTRSIVPSSERWTGRITAGGSPLANAPVSVTGQEARSTTTNANGIYNLTGLPVGGYSVTSTPTGFNCPTVNTEIEAHQLNTIDLVCVPQVGRIDGTIPARSPAAGQRTDNCETGKRTPLEQRHLQLMERIQFPTWLRGRTRQSLPLL